MKKTSEDMGYRKVETTPLDLFKQWLPVFYGHRDSTPSMKAAPKTQKAVGPLVNMKMPNTVDPLGPSRAIVAFSIDSRFERDEKYVVCELLAKVRKETN